MLSNRLITLLFLYTFSSLVAAAERRGAILVYHHVSSSTPASTSVSPDTLKQHLEYLKQHHVVVSLPELVAAIKGEGTVPDKAVAITFDDGYANIFENGHPLLKAYGFAYTVFISPDVIGTGNQLSWQQIKQMQAVGVLFANHSLGHKHLIDKRAFASEDEWLTATMAELQQAEDMLIDKLGTSPGFIAYPYGEYSQALSKAVKAKGWVGFAQHSGAAGEHSDLGALPRFAAAGPYAQLKSLKVKLASLPLAHDGEHDPVMAYTQSSTPWQLLVTETDFYPSVFGCFFEGDRVALRRDGRSFSADGELPIKVGRSRINCTAPSIKHKGRYYWLSQPYFRSREDGSYPE